MTPTPNPDRRIDDMPAGPELDRLVAKKVMGWEINETPEDDWTLWDTPTAKDRNHRRRTSESFRPSIDIAHAWEGVEKIRPTACFDLYYINGWVASFDPSGNPNATADTAPLAICRAALLATSPNRPTGATP